MPVQGIATTEIVDAAYRDAWVQFKAFPSLCPDEKELGPRKLRQYIEALVAAGERDAMKIAHSALGLLRQCEQITRSKASVDVRRAP